MRDKWTKPRKRSSSGYIRWPAIFATAESVHQLTKFKQKAKHKHIRIPACVHSASGPSYVYSTCWFFIVCEFPFRSNCSLCRGSPSFTLCFTLNKAFTNDNGIIYDRFVAFIMRRTVILVQFFLGTLLHCDCLFFGSISCRRTIAVMLYVSIIIRGLRYSPFGSVFEWKANSRAIKCAPHTHTKCIIIRLVNVF